MPILIVVPVVTTWVFYPNWVKKKLFQPKLGFLLRVGVGGGVFLRVQTLRCRRTAWLLFLSRVGEQGQLKKTLVYNGYEPGNLFING